MSNERRRHRRFTLQLDADIDPGRDRPSITGSLMEISSGGALLVAPLDVADGAPVSMRFRYQGEHVCEATGHVIRSTPFGQNRGIALSLGVANPALQAFLRALVQMPETLQPTLLGAIDQIRFRFR